MLTPVERVLLLQKVDLLERATPRALASLAEMARELEMIPGQVLYTESDLADAVYVVAGGRVHLTNGDTTLSEIGPGEAFGTWALVDESEREHRAECIEAGRLLALGREDFDEFTVNAPVVLRGMIQVLARRLRGLAERLPDTARIEAEGTSAGTDGDEASGQSDAADRDRAAGKKEIAADRDA
jgi:CRP-like cAMP-binding protein